MKLSIIIVSYNTKKLLEQCIDSVKEALREIEYEVVVVDNNSKDGSTKLVKDKYPNIKLIQNSDNVGFAKANNQGLEHCTGELVLLLNSDTIILGTALSILVKFMEDHKDAAICGPKLLNRDLTLQLQCRRGFPKFINSLSHFSGLSKLLPKSKMFGSYLMTHIDSSSDHEVDSVSGACLLVRKAVLDKIGGLLDESYFMHFEDVDLCYRAKKNNYKVYYVHNSEVIHLKGQSSKLRNEGVTRNFFDSAQIYFKKNYREENPIAYISIKIIIMVMKFISMLSVKIKNKRST